MIIWMNSQERFELSKVLPNRTLNYMNRRCITSGQKDGRYFYEYDVKEDSAYVKRFIIALTALRLTK